MANSQSGQPAIENQTCSITEWLDEVLEFPAPVAASQEVKLETQVSLAAVKAVPFTLPCELSATKATPPPQALAPMLCFPPAVRM